jgi:hypothetical protein
MSQQVSTEQYTALMRLAHERLAARFAAARTNAEYAAVRDDVYACVPMDDSFMIAYQANTPLRIQAQTALAVMDPAPDSDDESPCTCGGTSLQAD